MSEKVIGNQYLYNGPGYLDSKIQPVDTIADLNKILLRQRFIGLTVTVIHPDGPDSVPADYWLVQDPNEEDGVLMWERKSFGGTDVSIDTNTPDYIQVTKDGSTYYVDASGNFVSEIDAIKSGITETNERIGVVETKVEMLETKVENLETSASSIETKVEKLETSAATIETRVETVETNLGTLETKVETLETGVSSLTETVTTEVERINEKNDEQDERLGEISQWHIEKFSDESGLTKYALVDASGNTIGDTIDITEEQYLETVIYIPSATQEDKDIDPAVIIGDPYLKFVWKYDIITYVAIKDWVNDYFAGPGIEISAGHEISVKLDDVEEGNQNYLSVNSNGLAMNMMIEIDE